MKSIKDLQKLQTGIKRIRIICRLTENMVKLLLERFPSLEQVILTRKAKRSMNRKIFSQFAHRGIDIIYDLKGPGRPVKFSRIDLMRMRIMREKGFSYQQIAETLGISKSSVFRALNEYTKFIRWKEDYNAMESGKVVWMEINDGNPDARKLADNHYSRKKKGARLFCGPGEKLVLITPDKKALFIWRKNKIRWDGQNGVECALFRNEGAGLSSELIKEAVKIARKKWPGERLFTYVNPNAVKSAIPGFCFMKAGWKIVGFNRGKRKLIILEAPID